MSYYGPLSPEETRWRKEEEQLLKEAKAKNWRALFAAFVTTIFASGMAGLEWRWAILGCLAIYSVITMWVWVGVGVEILNIFVARAFMKTNNRWFVWMCVFVFTLFIRLIFTTWGGDQVKETATHYSTAVNASTNDDTTQRMNNAQEYGRYNTDQELIDMGVKVEAPKPPPVTPNIRNSVPHDLNRTNWWIRFTCFVILVILTVIYFFFAAADEAGAGREKIASIVREKTEGDVLKAATNTAVPVVAATLGADAGGGVIRKAMDEIFWNTAIDNGQKQLKKITSLLKRGIKS